MNDAEIEEIERTNKMCLNTENKPSWLTLATNHDRLLTEAKKLRGKDSVLYSTSVEADLAHALRALSTIRGERDAALADLGKARAELKEAHLFLADTSLCEECHKKRREHLRELVTRKVPYKDLEAENARLLGEQRLLVKGGNHLAQLLLDGEGDAIEGWEEIADQYEEGGIQAIGRALEGTDG